MRLVTSHINLHIHVVIASRLCSDEFWRFRSVLLYEEKIKLRWALFVTYTIIQSITSSEMCSLHLTHPSAHTPGAVDTHTHTHTHTWSSGHTHTHTHTHTWSSGHTHTHLEQWTHTHTHTHTHTWSSGGPSGEQSGVRCLAQGSHLSRGQFLPEPRFKPTTSGYKSNALSIRPWMPNEMSHTVIQLNAQ